jgi:hypothetical protein
MVIFLTERENEHPILKATNSLPLQYIVGAFDATEPNLARLAVNCPLTRVRRNIEAFANKSGHGTLARPFGNPLIDPLAQTRRQD